MNKTRRFLFFLALITCGEYFIMQSFKFIVYDVTHSKSAVSIIGSVAAISFIILGTFSGVIVDAISRRFFVYFKLISAAFLSIILFILFHFGLNSVWIVFIFIVVHQAMNVFSSAARNSIFYDLCGEQELAKWISYKSIVISGAIFTSYVAVNSILEASEYSFLLYSIILAISFVIFTSIGYTDQNIKYNSNKSISLYGFIVSNLLNFLELCKENRFLTGLFILSFLKTMLIFWPMSSGVLFQIGIEHTETKRIYLLVTILMELVSIVSIYFLGRYQKLFTIKSFIIGIIISGTGILFFGFANSYFWMTFFLGFLYVGLAISQMSSSFLLRMELPQKYRTQGLSFAVVPYYFADFCSGILFALLLNYISTQHLLIVAGFLLIVLGFFALILYGNPEKFISK